MPYLHASPRMIAASDADAVTGSFEVTFEPHRRAKPDPDPGDTVRLGIFERSIRIWPMAHA